MTVDTLNCVKDSPSDQEGIFSISILIYCQFLRNGTVRDFLSFPIYVKQCEVNVFIAKKNQDLNSD